MEGSRTLGNRQMTFLRLLGASRVERLPESGVFCICMGVVSSVDRVFKTLNTTVTGSSLIIAEFLEWSRCWVGWRRCRSTHTGKAL